jgi:hypothetical protein
MLYEDRPFSTDISDLNVHEISRWNFENWTAYNKSLDYDLWLFNILLVFSYKIVIDRFIYTQISMNFEFW